MASDFSFSKASGFYGTDFALSVTAPAGTTVYYTLDGSDPATSSSAQVYSGPVTVKDRSQEPNIYANYEEGETDISVSRGIGFRKPSFNVDKATVVRAAAKGQDGKFSSTVSATYFITSGKLSQYSDMTVISLVSDPENFFGPEKGIYVTGRQYMNWRQSGDYKPNKSVWDTDNKCNYFSKGSDWEREVTVSLFENGSLSLEQNMGIRIKGASTRNHAQKSFNLFARSEYGASKINLPLIPDNTGYNGKTVDKYDSVSLRSASSEERLRDGFAQKLLKDMDGITTQKMRPCVVFLNGEYWGLYEITEKLSDYFTETHYGVRKQDVAMIKSGEREEGPQEETDNFLQTADRFAAMNLADRSAYSEVCSFIDIDSMIEHYAAGLFLGTYDWPNRNYGVWKSTGEKDPDNKYTDGRWRFITYDLDYTMGQTYENFGGTEGYAYNSFTHMEKGKKDQPTALFLSLLKNDEFRAKFANTYSDLANTILTSEKAGEMADYYSKNYAGLIADSQVRWWGYFHGNPESYRSQYKSEYQNKILGQIKTFFQQRKSYGMDQMKKYLGLSGQMQTVTVKVSGGGKVKVSSLTADSSSVFTSQYLSDAPVTLTAVPDPGSSFAGWGGDASGSDLTITVPLSKAVSITASFSESTQTGTAGDINRDGKITSADLAELTAYFTGVKNPENISAADMNSDGKVNIADICILKSRLTGQS